MKITVRNLGAIKEAEFDLKPLTILIGPNNAGKTWLAYTLAGIFGRYGWRSYAKGEHSEEVVRMYPPIIEAVDEIMATGVANMDLFQLAQEYGEMYFNDVALHAREWLPDFMDTSLADFKDFQLSIQLGEAKTNFLNRVMEEQLRIDVGVAVGVDEPKPLLSIQKKSHQKEVKIYTVAEGTIEEKIPREDIEGRLAWGILRIFHHALYPDIIILPTERSTLVTMPFNALEEFSSRFPIGSHKITNEPLSSNDISLIKNIGKLTIPVSQYFSAASRTSTFGMKERINRDRAAQKNSQIKAYMDLAGLLEQKVLGGKVDFSTPEPEPTREIHFKPDEAPYPLELSITSSMIKELTPLVFYLRYFAKPGQWLIIDEPEMNLHPEAQVKIIEFLAMLVNAGLHVLVTTHSPYVVDHLLNLRKASEHTDQEAISDRFFLGSKDAFISQQKSAVYLVDQGKIKNVLDEEQKEEEEQDEDTFGKISDRISEIYFTL